ncbi:MAG: WYL domain-containing protein [Alphaproteobacteria bacterium]|nr:WYL domain-containing protein [Alphaproteobacteria bacterium]
MHILSRLERLDLLESWLKSDEPLVLKHAANELGVSLRTINRDIEILRERGVPVEADRGRGGGVRLQSTWGVGRVNLTFEEVIDLLIGLAIGEHQHHAIQMAKANSIRRKLLASFSHPDQRRINSLRDRIRTGATSSSVVISSLEADGIQVGDQLKRAFFLMRAIEIEYTDGQGAISARTVEPHYLVHNPPVWYVMCWDRLRNDIRTFRCDRIDNACVIDEQFALRPWVEFARTMEGNDTERI